MNLSSEQKHDLEKGLPVPVTIDGLPCVVVRQEKYNRVMELIEYDDSKMDPRELYPMILSILDDDDENPDQYLEYLNDPPR
ncbi:MAG: hypothetical protein KY475_09925 [Planctomycetes bacterium]|nr:hypothetical protein [Planctomycetota bacterium]